MITKYCHWCCKDISEDEYGDFVHKCEPREAVEKQRNLKKRRAELWDYYVKEHLPVMALSVWKSHSDNCFAKYERESANAALGLIEACIDAVIEAEKEEHG